MNRVTMQRSCVLSRGSVNFVAVRLVCCVCVCLCVVYLYVVCASALCCVLCVCGLCAVLCLCVLRCVARKKAMPEIT